MSRQIPQDQNADMVKLIGELRSEIDNLKRQVSELSRDGKSDAVTELESLSQDQKDQSLGEEQSVTTEQPQNSEETVEAPTDIIEGVDNSDLGFIRSVNSIASGSKDNGNSKEKSVADAIHSHVTSSGILEENNASQDGMLMKFFKWLFGVNEEKPQGFGLKQASELLKVDGSELLKEISSQHSGKNGIEGIEVRISELQNELSTTVEKVEQEQPKPQSAPKSTRDQIRDAIDFGQLKSVKQSNKGEFGVSVLRQAATLAGGQRHSIVDEEKEFNRYNDAIEQEIGDNGHFNQEIRGTNGLIQRFADRHKGEEGVDKLKDMLSSDKKFSSINLDPDKGDVDKDIKDLCDKNGDLRSLVDERNRLVGLREERVAGYKNIANAQLDYAKTKIGQEHAETAFEHDKQKFKDESKTLLSSVLKQSNSSGRIKSADLTGGIWSEIKSFAQGEETPKGLIEAVVKAFELMSGHDDDKIMGNLSSTKNANVFKIKLDKEFLGLSNNEGDDIMRYAEKSPKLFVALLGEKVDCEFGGKEKSPISDSLEKLDGLSSSLKESYKELDNARNLRSESRDKAINSREYSVTRGARGASDMMAEAVSGASNISRAGVHDTETFFTETVPNAMEETGKAIDEIGKQFQGEMKKMGDFGNKVIEDISGATYQKKLSGEREEALSKMKEAREKKKSVSDMESVTEQVQGVISSIGDSIIGASGVDNTTTQEQAVSNVASVVQNGSEVNREESAKSVVPIVAQEQNEGMQK